MFNKGSRSHKNIPASSPASARAPVPQKDPKTWSTQEVGAWLDNIGMGKYKKAFQDNMVEGSELIDLTDSDLSSIKLNSSERAKILLAIQQLRIKWSDFNRPKNSPSIGDDDSSSHSSSSGNPSLTKSSTEISIKCVYKEEFRRFHIDKTASLHQLKKKIKHVYGHSMTVKYKDVDGDVISVRSEEDWRHCLQHYSGREVRLELRAHERSLLSTNETQVLQTMVDGVIVIDAACKVLFANRSCERLLGYKPEEIVGQNVKMLMPPEVAANHDEYVTKYLRTREAKVIGAGRAVQAKRKDGVVIDVDLSVSHSHARRQDIFTGTLRVTSTTTANTAQSAFVQTYNLLENLPNSSIALNEEGIIQFANHKAQEVFGYTLAELVGRNVKMLMPPPFSENHDNYLRDYVRTGVRKIIGSQRDVVAITKDGSIIPIVLAVSEQWVGSQRIFTGVLFRQEESIKSEKTVLQQEREVTTNLVVAAVVIDQKGVIQGFNSASEKLWGYSFTEVVGRNVKMLMSHSDAERHDDHIRKYLETGRHKVIGSGRDVVAQTKVGDLVPIRLSVSERRDGEKKIWTGIIQRI